MMSLSILILLSLILIVFLRNTLLNNYITANNEYEAVKDKHNKLIKENDDLIKGNTDLMSLLEETINLYDMTKQICKYLDEEKVFGIFKEQVSKYIKNGHCDLLKGDADLSKYGDCITIPLIIDKTPIGYLVATGVLADERDKFNILAQQFILGIKRAMLYRKISESAISDSLTGVLSRRHWLERFNQEVKRSKKFKFSFSLLMIDIDHFKMCNDRYGHLVGDAVLKEVAKKIKENIRQVDLVCRYGGEEFAVILIEIDEAGAIFAATRILRTVEEKKIRVYDEDLRITVSIGVSSLQEQDNDGQELIEKADCALYQAKQSGRNKVCAYGADKV